MTPHDAPHLAGHRVRVFHVPRAAALLLAIPVFLALGIASLAVFLVAVAALFLAPLHRRRHEESRSAAEGDTITLDQGAYRTVPDDVAGLEGVRAANPNARLQVPYAEPGRDQ